MKFTGAGKRFMVLFVILSLTTQTILAKSYASERIVDLLSFGKDWYVYIKAHAFDIMFSAICKDTNCTDTNFASVHKTLALLPNLANLKWPCQGVNISTVRKRDFGKIYTDDFLHDQVKFHARSTLCGNITATYGFHPRNIGQQDVIPKHPEWFWQIHVNPKFILNITCISLKARFQPSCIATRALIEEIQDYEHKYFNRRFIGSFCPENPTKSFYSTGNAVGIYLLSSKSIQGLFWRNSYFNEWVGTLSFSYQIQDRSDWSFDPLLPDHYPIWKYDYSYLDFHQYDVHSNLYKMIKMQNSTLSLHLHASIRNNTSMLDRVPHLHGVFEGQNRIVYFLFFQSFLGAIFAVTKGSLECSNSDASLVAYEGPLVDLNIIDHVLVRLQEWSCGYIFNANETKTELKGRIGDTTIVIFVDKIRYFDLLLNVELRDIEGKSTIVLQQKFNLVESPITTYLDQNGTFFYILCIATRRDAFVSIIFDHLSFEGYTDSACTYGGLFLKNDHRSYGLGTSHVGGICSSQAAEQFLHLYGHRGLTLYARAIIYVKQYRLLSQLSAKLRFSLDRCLSMINYLPIDLMPLGVYTPDVFGIQVIKEQTYYELGSNWYYRWELNPMFFGMKRHINNPCLKLEYIMFNNLAQERLPIEFDKRVAVIGVGHVENVKPSRFSVAFWNGNDTVFFFRYLFGKCFASFL